MNTFDQYELCQACRYRPDYAAENTQEHPGHLSLPVFICKNVQAYIGSLSDDQPDQRLFPVTKSLLQHEMIQTTKKAGLKRIRVHDLRHSHASMLIEEGFSALLISERLGHENIETTLQTYSHLYPNKQLEVTNRLDQMLRY